MLCNQCPRKCNTDRQNGSYGFCGTPNTFLIARIAPHLWEEPSISGKNGSGTVFFGGCNLHCVFCQNRTISHTAQGKSYTAEELTAAILHLRESGVHNINLVTPSHYTLQLIPVLKKIKPRLGIPVVWNSSGYESTETLRLLEGLVDIYLPDFKYCSAKLSAEYSAAPDYYPIALAALREMLRQTGTPMTDPATGLLRRGTVVRHLVLPGCRKDSIKLLHTLAKEFGTNAFLLSLMCQYTPEFAADCPHKNLHRRLTSFEYQSVLDEATSLGFHGYTQDASSATSAFTPDFSNGNSH
ncbi:MAG: 4Fe-4S cluster-binding domain-containing protein [Clostridia bacterium]|nr:4Fe-4S cluster-binding domain-containing protein [Clostridia bacterium]